ncbi:MAG: hypothetical protein V4640_12620, partial [Verrucomicrobiota bacterium]
FHDGHTRVGGSEVDSEDFRHGVGGLLVEEPLRAMMMRSLSQGMCHHEILFRKSLKIISSWVFRAVFSQRNVANSRHFDAVRQRQADAACGNARFSFPTLCRGPVTP